MIFRNTGAGTADVGGWRLVDLKDHVIIIPSSYSIPPGGTLMVYTGPGDSTADRYFHGRNTYGRLISAKRTAEIVPIVGGS